MGSLYPGVRATRSRAHSAEELARRAVALAEEAAAQGTFGVGGVVLSKSGQVFGEAVNAVVQNGHVVDPTAHVERQLVDWLLGDGRRHSPVALADIVVVSSLDPCAMCAGALLRAGINVISLAADELSGVHGTTSEPTAIPRRLQQQAHRQMALFGVERYRPRAGADLGELFEPSVSRQLLDRAHAAFSGSVDAVRRIVAGSFAPHAWGMPAGGPAYAQIVRRYGCDLPEAAWISDDAFRDDIDRHWPGELGCLLQDPAGRAIIGIREVSDAAPTTSAVVRLIRAYSDLRNAVPATVRVALPHPRYCTIVVNRFPDRDDQALFELGAIGSFMEEERPPEARPALLYLTASDDRRPQEILEVLPPLYTQVIGLVVARLRR